VSRGRVAIGVALAAVTIVTLGCSGDDKGDVGSDPDLDWSVTVAADVFGLRFVLPSEPERLVQQVRLPDGTPSELVVHSSAGDGWELLVSTLPLDPATYDLGRTAPGAAAAIDGELVSVEPITVAGRPGRDAEIEYLRDGEVRILLYRAVLLDDGLVQVQTLGPRTDRASLEARHRALVRGLSWE
jgi:hypothetical protein